MQKDEKFISVKDALRLLGVSFPELKNLEKVGQVKTYPSPSGHNLYKQSEIEELKVKGVSLKAPTPAAGQAAGVDEAFNTKSHLTVAAAAQLLGISTKTIRRLIAGGKITPQAQGKFGALLLPREQVIKLQNKNSILTVAEAANLLNVSTKTIRRLIAGGKITPQAQGKFGALLISRDQIIKLQNGTNLSTSDTFNKVSVLNKPAAISPPTPTQPGQNIYTSQNVIFPTLPQDKPHVATLTYFVKAIFLANGLLVFGIFAGIAALIYTLRPFPNLPFLPQTSQITDSTGQEGGQGQEKQDLKALLGNYLPLDGGTLEGKVIFNDEAEFNNLVTFNGDLVVASSATFNGGLDVSGVIAVNGNKIIGADGKIPALTEDYFASLDGSEIINVNAKQLQGLESADFLRSNASDTAEGAINFTALPGGNGVGGGPVYVNPGNATANYTLFGVAVNGSQRFKIDAEGDTYLAGGLYPQSNNAQDIGSESFQWRNLYVSGSISSGGSLTLSGDLAVNGGDITTTSTSATLFNSTVTTLSLGGAATTLSIGASSGTTTVNNSLTVTGTLTANGPVALGNGDDAVTINGTTFSATESSSTSFNISDNITDAWDLQQSTNNYINVNTTNNSENVSFGNSTINPTFNFLGTGSLSIASTSVTLSAATTLTASSLTTFTGGATAIDFTEFDVSASTGSVTINDTGDAGQLLVEGTNLDINSLDFVGVGTITSGSATNLTFTPGTTGDLVFSTDADTTATFSGSAEGTANVILTAGDLTITDGDLTLSGGEISATADDATGTSFSFTGVSTTGTVLGVTANSLSTGSALSISSASTAGGASGISKLLDLSRSGANLNTAHTAYGLYSAVTNTNATSGTNIAGYFSASGATTANYGLIVENGNVGIGDTSPSSLLEVGNGTDSLQVSSVGDLTFVNADGAATITGPSGGALNINAANSQNLALATTTAGNITLTPAAAAGLVNVLTGNLKIGTGTPTVSLNGEDVYITGTLEVGGSSTFSGNTFSSSNITLGDAASDTITFTGVVNSNITPSANSTYDFGSSSKRWANGYFVTLDATNISGTVTGGSTTSSSWTINSDNATANAEIASLAFETGSNPINAVLQWNASGDGTRYDSSGGNQNDVNLFNYPIGIYSQVSGGNQTFTSGSLFKYYQNTTHAITQSAAFLGTNIDFSSNLTVPNSSSGNQTGHLVTLKDGGASATAIGFQTAGTFDYGLDIGGTPGTADIRLSNAETIKNTTNGTITLTIDGTSEVDLTSTAFSPSTSDGTALGTTSLMWSDLFLASGGVINFNNGDVTITHSSDLLTVGGGAVTITGVAEGTAALTLTAGDAIITDGDLTLSGGEIAATSDDATGTNFSFTTGALSTGTGVGITSTSQVITSGGLLSAALTSSSATASFTGDIGTLSTSRTNATALQTLTDTGNILDLGRTTITNHASATTNVTDPILNITNTATQTLGTLSDSANLVVITQDADATGALLHLVSNRSSTNYSLLIEQTSGGTDTLSLTDAGNLAINGDFTVTGGDLNGPSGENIDLGEATADTITAYIATAAETTLTATAFSPATSDGNALGTSSLMWSDLFLASGGVIYFNNTDVTLTHSLNALTQAGGDLVINYSSATALNIQDGSGNNTHVLGSTTGVIFNENSADLDFRIETDTNSNALVLDAGLFSGVGQFSIGSAAQSTATAFTVIDNPAITATSNQNFFKTLIDNNAAVTITGATTSAIVASLAIDEPNITATGTVTDAATLYIQAAPTEGGTTNAAILVDSGSSIFDGDVVVGGSTSRTETITNSGFSLGGDDLFVAGLLGIEGNIYTDGDVDIAGGDVTTANTTATLFNTTATTLSLGGAATTQLNLGNGSGNYTAINLGSGAGTHTINIAGTGATAADTINIGTGGTGADTINIGSSASTTAINLTSGTGSQTFASSVATASTTSSAWVFTGNSLTTGTGLYINSTSLTQGKLAQLSTGSANTLTTGTLLDIRSTATSLTGAAGTGSLVNLDWSPGSSTTATGDLFALNIGTNGTTTGKLFNILDASSSIFSVSETDFTTSQPANFTSAGDVGIAYDINFTNPTASYIKSLAPLYIQAGETFASQDLTLKTYNQGSIVLDVADTTGTGVNYTNTTITTGIGFDASWSALTTSGVGLKLSSTGTGLTSGSLLSVSSATTGAVATNGLVSLNASGNYTSTSNIGLLTVLANSTAAGTIQDIQGNALTTGQALYVSSTGTGLTTGSLLYVTSATTGAVNTNGIVSLNATGAYTSTSNNGLLNVLANSTQSGTIVNISGTSLTSGTALNITAADTTGNAVAITTNSLTSGNALALSSNSTGATSPSLINLSSSGAANSSTRYGIYNVLSGTGTSTTNIGEYISSTGATTNYGVQVAAMTGATSYGLDIGNMSGATLNRGINIGTLGTATTSTAINVGANSSATANGLVLGAFTGTTANTGINVGAISGTGATGTGITIGNISTTGATNYGLQLGTMTGGTTSNYQISTGVLTSATTTTNAQINLGGVVTTGGTTNYGINVGALSGTGTTNYGLAIQNSTSTGTTYGINVGTLTGAGTANYGVYINAPTSASTNIGLYNAGTTTLVGDVTLSGDIAVNGDDITSDGNLTIAATGYVRIGDSGTPGSATGDDALYVEGAFEVDGASTFDGSLTANGSLTLGDGGDAIALSGSTFSLTTTSTNTFNLADNITNALDIQEATNNYININTTNSSENLTLSTARGSGGDAISLIAASNTSGNAVGISSNALTSGTTLLVQSTATSVSSGKMLYVNKTGSSGSTAFTGDIANITYSQTFDGGVGLNSTGNTLDISRAITLNNVGNTHTISGALVALSSTGTQTAGTLTDTGNILSLTQSYASATGAILKISNAGSGADIALDNDETITNTTDGTISFGVAGSAEIDLTASALYPNSDGGNALGITNTNEWANLYLNTGGVIGWENSDVTITHSSNTLTFAAAASGYVFNNGNVYINDTANTGMTTGLTINQGAADNETLALKSSDVAHGVTSVTETDTYAYLKKINNGTGGLEVRGLNASTGTTGISLVGIFGTANTTKSTSGAGAVEIEPYTFSGTALANVATNQNLFAIKAGSAGTEWIVDKEGDVWQNGDIAVDGGDVTTAATTATLFNTTATTLSIGGAATTTFNIGSTTTGTNAFAADVDLTFAGNENTTITNSTNTLGASGMLDLASTGSTTDTRTLDLSTTFTSTGATTSYGLYNTWASSAVVTGASVSQTAYGNYTTATKTGADDATGTYTLYGDYVTASNTGRTAAGTVNTYGGYFSATGDTAGTTTTYGLYTSALGGDTNYGLAVAAMTGATSYGIDIGNMSGATLNRGINIGTLGTATTSTAINVGANSSATANGLVLGAFTGTTANTGINIGAISGTSATGTGITVGNISTTGTTNYGLQLGTMTGGTTSNYQISTGILTSATTTTNAQLDLGGVVTTGGTTNYGIALAALSGSGTTNKAINIATLTTTGTTSTGIDINGLTGASSGTKTGLNIGAISGTSTNNYGIALSTLTGGTTANYMLTTGTLTAISSSTSYQVNLGATAGASSATFGAINTGALSGAGTASYGLNLGANSSTATTNSGITIGAVSGAGTTNYGINVGAVTGATTNYGVYIANGSTYGLFVDAGDGRFDEDLIVGGSTSSTSTISAGFSLGGDDLFVAGMAGVEGNIYTDADLNGGDLYLGFDDSSATLTTYDTNESLTITPNGTGNINLTTSTGVQTFTSSVVTGTTTTSGFVFDATAITSGTGLYLTTDSVTTGKLLDIATSGNTFTTGTLVNIASTSTALTSGRFLNINNGSDIFTVSNTDFTTSLPTNFTSAGDVGIAYDINFTNPTASYIKSLAPLYIQAGETFASQDLTLKTYNQGSIVLDVADTTGTGVNYTNTTLTTGIGIDASFSALTTGDALKITSTGTSLTTGSLLYVSTATTGAVATDGVVSIQASGAYTSTSNVGLLSVLANSTTAGTITNINGNALTTGVGQYIGSTGTGLTSGSLLYVTSATTGAVATNGIVSLNASGNYTSTSNIGLLSVLANSTAAGTIQNIQGNALTTGNALRISSTGTGLTSGSLLYLTSATTGAVATNGIVSINATGNYTSTSNIGALTVLADSTAAGTIQRISGNALTTGEGLSIQSTGTGLTSGSLLKVTTATTGALATNGVVSINASGAYTSSSNVGLLNVSATALTGTGTVVNISSSAAGQLTNTLLNVAASGYTTGYTGNVVSLTGVSTTGASNLLNLTSANTTDGNALNITANGITTGDGLDINSTGTGLTSGSLIKVTSATTGAVATNGIVSLNASGNYTSTSNIGLLSVLANSTAAGTIANINGNALTTGVGQYIGSTGTGLTSGSLLYVTSATTGAVATNGIVSLNASGNYTSTSNIGLLSVLANSTAAGTIQNIQGNALTTGNGLRISSTGTALTTGSLLYLTSATSGAVATNGIVSINATGNYTSTSNMGALAVLANSTQAGTIQNIQGNALTTGRALDISSTTTLTTGQLVNVSSTSTALTTGSLMSLDWSPGSATAATGDLFKINIGSSATTFAGNLFNVLDNSSSIFSVSKTAVTSALPASFTAAGDVTIAYDINFTNPTASYIKSSAPLYIQAGETFGSSDLTLRTFNNGVLNVDAANGSLFTRTSGTVASFNRKTDDGTIVSLQQDGTEEGTISVSTTTVSYNAFTGSHYAWTNENIKRGELVTLTGDNKYLHDNLQSEILYGIAKSTTPNDAKIMGAYLSLLEPSREPSVDNPHLVMAVGNGDLWVVDQGENLEVGDYLISSTVPGHAMRDNGTFKPAHIIARVAEPVDWSQVTETVDDAWTPRRHKKISVFFENYRESNTNSLLAQVSLDDHGNFVIPNLVTNSLTANSLTASSVSATQVSANQVDAVNLETRLATLETQYQEVANQLQQAIDTAGNINTFVGLTADNLTINNDLSVLGLTTLSDLSVTGQITNGILVIDGLNGEIHTLGAPLKIQENGFFGVEFLGGELTIDTLGNLITQGTLEANAVTTAKVTVKQVLGADTTIGSGTIAAGLTSVTIYNDQVKSTSRIFVTPKSVTDKTLAVVNIIPGYSFQVKIATSSTSNIDFSYWIVDEE